MALDIDSIPGLNGEPAPKRKSKVETEKDIAARCPKTTHEMAVHPETGLKVVAKTGLVPVYILKSVPERGWTRGKVHGLRPKDAVITIKNGFGMELKEGEVKAAVKPAKKDEKQPA
jgi:hypothetical protein